MSCADIANRLVIAKLTMPSGNPSRRAVADAEKAAGRKRRDAERTKRDEARAREEEARMRKRERRREEGRNGQSNEGIN